MHPRSPYRPQTFSVPPDSSSVFSRSYSHSSANPHPHQPHPHSLSYSSLRHPTANAVPAPAAAPVAPHSFSSSLYAPPAVISSPAPVPSFTLPSSYHDRYHQLQQNHSQNHINTQAFSASAASANHSHAHSQPSYPLSRGDPMVQSHSHSQPSNGHQNQATQAASRGQTAPAPALSSSARPSAGVGAPLTADSLRTPAAAQQQRRNYFAAPATAPPAAQPQTNTQPQQHFLPSASVSGSSYGRSFVVEREPIYSPPAPVQEFRPIASGLQSPTRAAAVSLAHSAPVDGPLPVPLELYQSTLASLEKSYEHRLQLLSETILRSISSIQNDPALGVLAKDSTSAPFVQTRVAEILQQAIHQDREALLSDAIKQLSAKNAELEALQREHTELAGTVADRIAEAQAGQDSLAIENQMLSDELRALIEQRKQESGETEDGESGPRESSAEAIARLEKELAEVQSKVAAQTATLEEQESKSLEYQHEIEDLKLEIKDARELEQERIEQFQAVKNALTAKLQGLQNEFDAAKKENEEKQKEPQSAIDKLTAERDSEQDRANKLKKKSIALASDKKALTARLTEIEEEVNRLRGIEEKWKAENENNTKLNEEIVKAREEIQSVSAKLSESLVEAEKRVGALTIQHSKELAEQAAAKQKEFEEKLESSYVSKEAMELELKNSVEQRVKELTQSYLSPEQHQLLLNNQLNELQQEFADYYKAKYNEEYKLILKQIQVGMKELEDKFVSEKRNNGRMQDEIRELNQQLNEEKLAQSELLEALNQSNLLIEKLKLSLEKEKNSVNYRVKEAEGAFNVERAKIETEIQDRENEIERLEDMLEREREANVAHRKRLSHLHGQLMAFQFEAKQLRSSIQLVSAQSNADHDQFAIQFESVMALLLQRIHSFESQYNAQSQQIKSIQADLVSSQSQNASLSAQIEQRKKDFAAIVALIAGHVPLPGRVQRSLLGIEPEKAADSASAPSPGSARDFQIKLNSLTLPGSPRSQQQQQQQQTVERSLSFSEALTEFQSLLGEHFQSTRSQFQDLSQKFVQLQMQLAEAQKERDRIAEELLAAQNEHQVARQAAALESEIQKVKAVEAYKEEIENLRFRQKELDQQANEERRRIVAEYEQKLKDQARSVEDLLQMTREEKLRKEDRARLGVQSISASNESSRRQSIDDTRYSTHQSRQHDHHRVTRETPATNGSGSVLDYYDDRTLQSQLPQQSRAVSSLLQRVQGSIGDSNSKRK